MCTSVKNKDDTSTGSASSQWVARSGNDYKVNFTRLNSNYAFDSSGSGNKTVTVSAPATATGKITHGYLTFTGAHTTTLRAYLIDSGGEEISSGWYELKYFNNDSYYYRWYADSDYSWGLNGMGFVIVSQSVRGDEVSPGAVLTNTPTHGFYRLSLMNCARLSGDDQGWYTLDKTPSTTVKADSWWSFGGSSGQDTTTIGGNALPATVYASPSYFYLMFSGTNCSPNRSNGFYTTSTRPASVT